MKEEKYFVKIIYIRSGKKKKENKMFGRRKGGRGQ